MRTLQQDGIDKVRMGITSIQEIARVTGSATADWTCRTEVGDEMEIDFAEILKQTVELNASDLHMTVGAPPMVRVRGELRALDGYPPLTSKDTRDLIYGILSNDQRKRLETRVAGRLLLLGARRTAASGSTPTCSAPRSAPRSV